MLNFNEINNLLFIDEDKIYLFVYNLINNSPNLLFVKSEDFNETTFKTKLLKILTVAGNFLGFNIKCVNVVINDSHIIIKNTLNQKYDGNTSKNKIEEILSSVNGPQLNNLFLNKIIFNDWMYDVKNNVTLASHITYWTNYDKTNFFINAILNECHLNINSIDNLYLLNDKNDYFSKNTIKIIENKMIYHQYDNGLLKSIIVKYFDKEKLLMNLAKEFSTSVELIKKILLIIKNTNLNVLKNINVNLSFDLQNNEIKFIDIEKLLTTYKREIISLVKNEFVFDNNLDNDFVNISDTIDKFDLSLCKTSSCFKLINLSFNNLLKTVTKQIDTPIKN